MSAQALPEALSQALCVARLEAADAEGVVRALSRRLLSEGRVLASFEAAAVARERRSPTGLPFPELAVAMPHAEPEHVVTPTVVVATLSRPVRFRQMGTPSVQLEVSLVVMPALGSAEQAAAALSGLVEALQDLGLRRALATAKDDDDLRAALSARRGPPC